MNKKLLHDLENTVMRIESIVEIVKEERKIDDEVNKSFSLSLEELREIWSKLNN